MLVLRTASDYDSPTALMTAAGSLARNKLGQYADYLRRSTPPGETLRRKGL